MIDWLIRKTLEQRALAVVTSLLLLVWGSVAAMRMPVDVFPDLTAPTVTVITEAHGMAPTEVETQVTFPIEAAVNGAVGVRRVRSATSVGISVVWVEFDWGTDIYLARQIVAEKIAMVSGDLPPEVDRPQLAPISSIMGEVVFAGVTSDRHTPTELHTLADTVMRPRLLSVPGVSQVVPTGGGERQYQVRLSPARMLRWGIPLARVAEALERSNENVSAGFLVRGGSELLVTGFGRFRSTADIEATVVEVVEGVPVRIRDLGEVVIGEGPLRGAGAVNGKPGLIVAIQKQPGANTLTLTRQLDRVFDELQAKLPEGIRIDKHMFRQADFIQIAVDNVVHALRDGGLLVVLVVMAFLANLRATVITLTAIPLSLVTAVLALQGLGESINTMTLGGMAIAIGALVDDAIIDVENVFRRLRENARLPEASRRPALTVVYEASVEIRASIVFATVIILLVFLPLFFLSGVEGRLLRPLGLAYVVSLAASLLVAVTLTPVLCSLLLPESRGIRAGHEPALVRWLKGAYGVLLGPVLRHPWLVTIPTLGLFVAAAATVPFLGRNFLPDFNEGALTISAVTLPGTSLAESETLARAVDRTLLSHPEVRAVGRRTGRAELDEHSMGVEASEVDVSLAMKDRSKGEFLAALRSDLTQIPGMNIQIGQPISHRIDHMLSGTRANVAVKIFGDDLYRLRFLAERARERMAGIAGVVDLSVEQQMDIPVLAVSFDRNAIARHGLTVAEVARTLRAAVSGVTVTQVLERRYAFDLVVRLGEDEGWTPETLGDLPVDTPAGNKVRLRELTELRRDSGPNAISREQVQRKIVVMCNVADRDTASVVADVRAVVDPLIATEPGYSVEYGGQFEAAEKAGRLLSLLGAAVVVGIGFLLHLAFGNARDALFVMVNLPLALIGGVAGVMVSGGSLSVASVIGFITVFGIAARNGIMLVSHFRHLQEHEGVTDFREAVRRGAEERLAPILMTALATALALLPLALGGGKPGNEIQTPMAIVILGGLSTSMLLNMILVPALYLRFGRPVGAAAGGAR